MMMFKVLFWLLTTSAFYYVPARTEDEHFEDSSNICSRCSCNSDDRKFVLNCKSKEMTEVLANWPPHDEKESLVSTFSYNNITTLKKLASTDAKLKVVFSHCGIKYLEPGVFEGTPNVQFIDLSYNSIDALQLSVEVFKGPYNKTEFGSLSQLTYLSLAYNQLHSIPHDLFEHMTLLEDLNLEGNDLTALDPRSQISLSHLHNLEKLNLANNGLMVLPPTFLSNMTSIKEINLAGNYFDFVPDELRIVHKTLNVLILDRNSIFELTEQSFLEMENIRHLSLNNLDRLYKVNDFAFRPLQNLRHLEMSNNKLLTYIDREVFGPGQVIEEIFFNNNSLKRLDPTLLDWSKIVVFDVKDNPLRCTCDLYNITKSLSPSITNVKDGPYCVFDYDRSSAQMYSLDHDVCETEHRIARQINRRFNLLRIALLSLSIILTFLMIVVIVVGFTKYRRHLRLHRYPFVTNAEVSYNPINTQLL